jgi:hypothetical protein
MGDFSHLFSWMDTAEGIAKGYFYKEWLFKKKHEHVADHTDL